MTPVAPVVTEAPVVKPVVVAPACPPVKGLPAPWVAATLDDYVPAALALVAEAPELACPSVAGDFDKDGAPDVMTLAVETSTRRSALVLLPAAGPARVIVEMPPPAGMGIVYRPIAPKPAGERVLRDALVSPDQLTAPAAVEVCRAPEAALTLDTVCYCSTWYWVEKGEVRSVGACD